MDVEWTGRGKVRARESGGVLEVVVDGLTTQAKYYKPLIYEFFRKEWRGGRRVDSWTPGRKLRFTITALIFTAFSVDLAYWGALTPWSG